MALWISLLIAGGVVAVDLISKALVDHFMALYQQFNVIPYLFDFQYVHNTGAAFSFLADWEYSRIFFIILTFLAVAAFLYVLIRYGKNSKFLSVTMALIIGGALGNLYDRMVYHYVRDFIRFAFWENFAVFNLADSALTIGVVMFAVYYIFLYKEDASKKKNAAVPSGADASNRSNDDASATRKESIPQNENSDEAADLSAPDQTDGSGKGV